MTEGGAFDYVVQRKAKQHVAFGTTQERDVSLLHSKFNRTSVKHVPEIFPNLSPLSYLVDKEKLGPQHGTCCSRAPRFKRVAVEGPSPNAYNCQRFPNPVPKSKVPFINKMGRDASHRNLTPGPGAYKARVDFMHNLSYYQNFGMRRIKVKAPDKVEDLHSKCGICHTLPIQNGEPFWKNITKDKDTVNVLCCDCMKNLQKEGLGDLKKKALMKKYRLVCECPYYIRHAGMPNYRVITRCGKDGELPKEARFDKFLQEVKEEENDE